MSGVSPRGMLAVASMAVGAFVALYNMFNWDTYQLYYAYATNEAGYVLSFYGGEVVACLLFVVGFYQVCALAGGGGSIAARSRIAPTLSVLGAAMREPRFRRWLVLGATLYGILYCFASSIIVVQPTVNFAAEYGVTSTSWSYIVCCGDVGTVPKLIVYVAPSLHLALQVVPLDLMLLLSVPPLVGLNVAVAMFSVRTSVAKVTGRWMAACGAAVGLFTACPTCAGLFLAESVGGIGATSLAVALAPFQAFFIAASIPLLLVTPFLFARRMGRAGMPTTARATPASPPGQAGRS